MRLLIVLLFLSGACQAQGILSQKLSLQRRNGTVLQWLNDLNQISGISISYSSGSLDLDRVVQARGDEETLEDFLRLVLQGQKAVFTESNGKVFIVPRSPVRKKHTISGYVFDKTSGERLIGASVYLAGSTQGTATNAYGFYSLTTDEDSCRIEVSHSGYTTYTEPVGLEEDRVRQIGLEPRVSQEQLVVINTEARNVPGRGVSKTGVTGAYAKSLPALLGEADVLKSLQLLPGVQSGNEGTSGLIVRGGSADQNLILLDGVPVYNASHAFGVFSVFNADAVQKVEILKSGFPASYGGRLSSVVDVRMKEGDRYRFHGEGGIGLIFSKLTLEGPIKKGRSSFLVSARRTYADLLIKGIEAISHSPDKINPFFTDLNVKANFPLGRKDHIYYSLYMGQDKLNTSSKYSNYLDSQSLYSSTFGFSWGNITALQRWNHEFSKKLFANFSLTYSRYRFTTDLLEEYVGAGGHTTRERNRYFSGIQDGNFRADFDYLPRPNHSIKTGISATLHRYDPGISHIEQADSGSVYETRINDQVLWGGEYDAYIEDDIRLSGRLRMNAGVRLSAFSVKGRVFPAVQPRITASYRLHDTWTLKASYSRMNQFIHLLTNSTIGLPTDLWVPVTARVPPQVSHHFAAGATRRFSASFEVSVEGYYKSMGHVVEYSQASGFSTAYDHWEDQVVIGRGWAFGGEAFAQKILGRWTGLLSYSIGRSVRQFPEINGGRPFPYKYDRRHEVKTALVYRPSSSFEMGASWLFFTGNAITLPISSYYDPFTQRYLDVFGDWNNARMPNYHRLDLSFKFSRQKKRHLRSWMFSFYNVYNHFNPFLRYKAYSMYGTGVQYEDMAVLPFLGSFGYQFKF